MFIVVIFGCTVFTFPDKKKEKEYFSSNRICILVNQARTYIIQSKNAGSTKSWA